MIWRLCVCYVDVMWMIWIHTVEFPHVHIYILDEPLSYPVSSPIATVLNSMHCFIYISHGPNQDYYATENCLITQGDKKYVWQNKIENVTYMFQKFTRR